MTQETPEEPLERIAAAAIYLGATISLPPPARHHTILASMDITLMVGGMVPPQCQGFITSTGRYVNRVEAYYLAVRAGQAKNKEVPELFSEDMW